MYCYNNTPIPFAYFSSSRIFLRKYTILESWNIHFDKMLFAGFVQRSLSYRISECGSCNHKHFQSVYIYLIIIYGICSSHHRCSGIRIAKAKGQALYLDESLKFHFFLSLFRNLLYFCIILFLLWEALYI